MAGLAIDQNRPGLGRLNSALAPLVNWGLGQKWVKPHANGAGCAPERQGCTISRNIRTVVGQAVAQMQGPLAKKSPCSPVASSTTGRPTSARRLLQVLEKMAFTWCCQIQSCCGMPSFDIGDTTAMVKAAEHTIASLKPWVDQGYDVVIPTPSCSLMVKRGMPTLVSGEDATRVAGAHLRCL